MSVNWDDNIPDWMLFIMWFVVVLGGTALFVYLVAAL